MIQLYDKLWFRVLMRFIRVFVIAGLTQVGIVLAATPLTSFNPDAVSQWLGLLVTAFLIGGIAALDKAIRECSAIKNTGEKLEE